MPILKRLLPKHFLAFCCLYAACFASLAQQTLPPAVADALRRAQIAPGAVAVYVREVGQPAPVLAWNESQPFNPASTMKLVTTSAALEMLGPASTWKTRAYALGVQQGDVLEGDLLIQGGGDPKFLYEHLWMFLRRLRERGIREIQGDLVLDRSMFEERFHDEAAFDGDPWKPYNVGPDALLLNYKAVVFRFMPDAASATVGVAMDPPLAAFPVIAPRLADGECGDWRGAAQPSIGALGASFGGGYPLACGERSWYVNPAALSHLQYFHLAFRKLWAELGGTLRGGLRGGTVPAHARLLAEWTSPSVAEIVRDINKFSNNVMARQLLLTLGHASSGAPATPEAGALAVRAWLAAKGIDAPELSIENGSGLSRTERVSALTMGRMLDAAFHAPTMPEFIASLPLVGHDGTMRRRLNGHTVAGRAHIKTGQLNEVRNIAGYVMTASGRRFVVVCMINHPNAMRGQEAHDALLQWVFEKY